MRIEELYRELKEVEPVIDEKLQNLDFDKVKALILWKTKSGSYQRIKCKDIRLVMLDIFCNIWLEEKKSLVPVGVDEDIFLSVNSLDTLEKKYLMIQFGLLRLETSMPEEYYEEFINQIIDYKISGIALYHILMNETNERENNILKLSSMLKQREKIMEALFLLQKGSEVFPKNKEILLELADCWMFGEQWKQAYDCLKKIKKPKKEVRELIQMLEKVI